MQLLFADVGKVDNLLISLLVTCFFGVKIVDKITVNVFWLLVMRIKSKKSCLMKVNLLTTLLKQDSLKKY